MAIQIPIVVIGGQLQQLPAGDTIPGAAGGTAPTVPVTAAYAYGAL